MNLVPTLVVAVGLPALTALASLIVLTSDEESDNPDRPLTAPALGGVHALGIAAALSWTSLPLGATALTGTLLAAVPLGLLVPANAAGDLFATTTDCPVCKPFVAAVAYLTSIAYLIVFGSIAFRLAVPYLLALEPLLLVVSLFLGTLGTALAISVLVGAGLGALLDTDDPRV